MRVSILESLEGVSSPIKMRTLLTALEGLANTKNVSQTEVPALQTQLAALLVSSIDGASLKDLNDPEGASWVVYKALVHWYFRPGNYCVMLVSVHANLSCCQVPRRRLGRPLQASFAAPYFLG